VELNHHYLFGEKQLKKYRDSFIVLLDSFGETIPGIHPGHIGELKTTLGI